MQARWGFYFGLALVTLVTLALEVISARLFSVISWYHLSFFAVSVAMLGMTAGAVYVYLRPRGFADDRVPGQLVFYSLLLAISLPICHLVVIRFRPGDQVRVQDLSAFVQLVLMTGTAAAPFFFSGVVVAVSLTRVALPIGRIYFFDLLGAGAGCLAAIILLQAVDPSSGAFLLGAMAGLATLGYAWDARGRSNRPTVWATILLTLAMTGAGLWNAAVYPRGVRLTHSKGENIPASVAHDRWNTHSRITANSIVRGPPHYWGPGRFAPRRPIRRALILIDGQAGTFVAEYHDKPGQIEWIKHDVTSLAYHLRGRGNVAVIGVGGGRDILTALAFGCRRVVGIELNRILLGLLERDYRQFSQIVDRLEVTLVHDDARSYLARSEEHFDLLQMSLVDTWASTSAGAMTLSENGLYTVEAWQTFLRRLSPQGVFTVSRWFSPVDLGETIRLVSLACAALLEEGVTRPSDHLMLATAGRVGTLIISPTPFSPGARETIRYAAARYGFDLALCPGMPIPDPRFRQVLQAASAKELLTSVTDPVLDLSPPYDERPFFFNLLRPRAWFSSRDPRQSLGGAAHGNLVATDNLMAILAAVTVLVVLSVILPLVIRGRRHGLGMGRFTASAYYFAAIGLGFMLIEIGLMQRFSVLLGHPIWSLAVVLFSMIVFAGIGSLVSDRMRLADGKVLLILPLAIAAVTALVVVAIQPAINVAVAAPLLLRVLVTLAFTIPLGFVLGFCFPLGMRLVQTHSSRSMPWMWGINGGFGVLGSVASVILSMAWGISWSVTIGGLCYLSLLLPIAILRRGPTVAG